jgi:RNA polymerase sigma-70 factor (ECF subfamily)
MQTTELTDIEIIERIVKGEKQLFELIIRRNNGPLYRTGRAYGYNHEDTQDLMQETFIHAYVSLNKFENRSTFRTWIIRIMLNNCHKKQQKFSFVREITGTNSINENSTPMYSSGNHSDTHNKVIRKELNDIIEHALADIPLDYRMVFLLREINGLNVAETAETLEISEANVKVRLNRARAALKREIEKTYSPEEIFEFNLVYCDAMVQRVMNEIHKLA